MTAEQMKILTINCVYKVGSTGKIIQDIADGLKDACHFVFCYETGTKSSGNHYLISGKKEFLFYYALARITGLKYSTGFTSTRRLIRFIKKQAPDIVHLHCPNIHSVNIPALLTFLKKNNIPTVVTNHAEFYYTGNCPHAFECEKYNTGCGHCGYVFDKKHPFLFDRTAYEWKRMKKAFDGFKDITMAAVSPWVASRMKNSPITNCLNSAVILNGIDTEIFNYTVDNFKRELGISETEKVILHVTAVLTDSENDIKGGQFILRLAARMKSTRIVVAGPHSLSDNTVIPENILLVGNVADQKRLAGLYSMADLTVITSRRETFGMACAESLCCGTPVVGFKAGGPESVALPQYSEFVEYGDEEALYHCVGKWLNGDLTPHEDVSNHAKGLYSKERMAREYYKQYEELLDIKRVDDKG